MKRVAGIFLTIFIAGAVVSSFAQSAFAQCAPNPKAEGEWQRFLSRHPGLRNHPEWLRNQSFMGQHPNMSKWLQEHPCVAADARRQGMWDPQGRWHDSRWWHQNNPDELWAYHPEWAREHSDWRGANDGDWDDQHNWHDRGWWARQHPEWVKQHHPAWYQHMQEEWKEHHEHDND